MKLASTLDRVLQIFVCYKYNPGLLFRLNEVPTCTLHIHMQNRLGIQKPKKKKKKKQKRKGYDEQRIFADHICGCWTSWARLAVRYIGAIAGGLAPPTSTCAGWKAKLNCWLASSAFRRPFAAAAAAAAGVPPANHDMCLHMSAACNIHEDGGRRMQCSSRWSRMQCDWVRWLLPTPLVVYFRCKPQRNDEITLWQSQLQ